MASSPAAAINAKRLQTRRTCTIGILVAGLIDETSKERLRPFNDGAEILGDVLQESRRSMSVML